MKISNFMKLDISVAQNILSGCDFFKRLSRENLRALADACSLVKLVKKDALFYEGTKGSSMYLLFEGVIRLFKTASDGNEVVIKVVKPVEIFAEVVLFERPDFPVSAVAIADSSLLEIPRTRIEALLEGRAFRQEFIAMLMERQRYLAQRIQYLVNYDVEERFFLFLENHYGDNRNIKINISKKDMASAIGATPETFSRLINRLEGEKKIAWNNGHCHIINKPELSGKGF